MSLASRFLSSVRLTRPKPDSTSALLVSLALLMAIWGQQLLAGSLAGGREHGDRLLLGVVLLLGGAAVFAWATPRPTLPSSATAGPTWRIARPHLLAAAGLLYAATLVLYLTVGENAVVHGGWLVSMGLMLAACMGPWPRPAWSRADGRDLILVTLITALAFGLRFWRLAAIPSFIHGDIASQGLQALAILRDPNPRWFGVGWSEFPLFDYVIMAWTMRLAGQDLFGLSLTAVWQGVLMVPVLYLLGREVGGRRVGLLAAFLLALDYTHIHFSRFVSTASAPFFLVLTLWAFWRGWRRRQSLWLAASGLSLGVGLMAYYSARVGVPILAITALGLLGQERQNPKTVGRPAMLFALATLIGFGPMLAFVGQDFSAFTGRGNLVTLANPDVMTHLMGKYHVATAGQVWVEQIKRSFLTFFLYPDASTHFAFPGPMVAAPTAVFMALGVGYALRHAREPRLLMLCGWWVVTVFLGSVVTNDAPFWPHIVIVLPAVCVLAAVAADQTLRSLSQAWPSARQADIGWVLTGLLVVVFLLAGREGWRAYLAWVGDNATPLVRVARFAWQSPATTRLVLVREPFRETERELLFMAHDRDLIGLERDEVAAFPADQEPTVFILTPNHADLVPVLQARWPQGVSTEHRAGDGSLAFLTYAVVPEGYSPGDDPAADLQRRSGVIWALALALTALGLAAGALIVRRSPPAPMDEAIAPPEPTPAPVVLVRPPQTPARPAAPRPVSSPPPSLPPEQLPTGYRLALVIGGVLIALALASIAQRFYDMRLTGPVMEGLVRLFGGNLEAGRLLLVGTLFYLAAGLVFALAAPELPGVIPAQAPATAKPRRDYPGELPPDARIIRPATKPRPTPNPTAAAAPFDRVQGLWLAAAALPYAWAMLRFARQGEDALVRWLWVAAVVLFLVGQVVWPLWRQRGRAGAGAEPSPPWRWQHVALLALVLAGGFWLRFNRLETIPDDFHGDMASMGLQAREWLAGITPYLFREGWANIPMKGFLPAALGLALFGNNLFGLNMSAVIAGMLTLVGLYLLVWRLFDSHRLALLATAVLAVNIPHIHFSRLAAYMDPWAFHFLALFAVVDGLRARRPASLALAGLLFGFGLEMYYSGRVLVLLVPPVFAYLLLTRRGWLRGQAVGYGLLIAGVLVALGPSLIYFARFREPLIERSRAVWLFYEPVMTHLKGKYGVQTEWEVLLEQLKRSVLMFNQAIDSSTQFGYPHPMFSSLLSPLVVLGFAYGLRRWRHPGLGLNLILLALIVIVGSALTGDAPFWPRLVGVLPAAALLAALVLDRLWALGEHLLREQGVRRGGLFVGLAILGFLAVAGRQNWLEYYAAVHNNARAQAFIGRYLYRLPPEVAACAFSEPYALSVRETYFLAWPRQVVDLPPDAPDEAVDLCPGPPFVWILTPNHRHRLDGLRARWPEGQLEDHFYGNGGLAFTSYLVTTGTPTPAALAPKVTPPPGEPAPPMPFVPVAPPAAPPVVGSGAYYPDGSPFEPAQTFLGNTNSTVWQIDLGSYTVAGGRFVLHIGPLPGHNAVYDYVEFVATDGTVYRFEAEDLEVTSGDVYAGREGADGHWWLQNYEPFSGGQGLVAEKQERVPVLTTSAALPDGVYRVFLGSFTGDPANGVFGVGLRWEEP